MGAIKWNMIDQKIKVIRNIKGFRKVWKKMFLTELIIGQTIFHFFILISDCLHFFLYNLSTYLLTYFFKVIVYFI